MFRRNNTNNSNNNDTRFAQQAATLIPAEVRLLSSCHSVQSSVDAAAAYEGGLPDPVNRAGGVATAALLEILYATTTNKKFSSSSPSSPSPPLVKRNNGNGNSSLTFQQLLLELRSLLADQGYDQIPQLTSSRPLELQKTPFDLGGHGGTKRALLVGINYTGQDGALSGCHNDVYSMKHYLKTVQGFLEKNIVVLIDDGGDKGDKHLDPSRHEIIRTLQLLVKDSMPGDAVFFHYSGHGGLLYPEANDFKAKYKGYDETIYPVDHSYSGQIHDFSLFRHFVQPMRAGVTVTVVMDCCHCGSVLELPYSFQPTAGGVIQMRQSMDALANLAFLQVLMGNILPSAGFDDVVQHIQNATNISLGDYLGIGLALEDQQGIRNEYSSDDNLDNSLSFSDLADDNGGDVYQQDEDNSDSGRANDCDCFGGGFLSFILSILGGGGGPDAFDDGGSNPYDNDDD